MFVVLLINSHFGSICGPKISPGFKLARDMYRGHTNAIVSLMNDRMSSICFTLNDERCHTHPAITSFTKTCRHYPRQGKRRFAITYMALMMTKSH